MGVDTPVEIEVGEIGKCEVELSPVDRETLVGYFRKVGESADGIIKRRAEETIDYLEKGDRSKWHVARFQLEEANCLHYIRYAQTKDSDPAAAELNRSFSDLAIATAKKIGDEHNSMGERIDYFLYEQADVNLRRMADVVSSLIKAGYKTGLRE